MMAVSGLAEYCEELEDRAFVTAIYGPCDAGHSGTCPHRRYNCVVSWVTVSEEMPPMIISASHRTDIPAFYAEWMVQRLREGYCTVANPFNRNQVTRISLKPEDVDAIVFWTRNPRPLMPYLDELDSREYHYYFQFTILGYPREIDAKSPLAATAVEAFRELSERLGPRRVIWRYDPIFFSGITPPAFHQENFQRLAESLRGHTQRVVVSIVDMYRKIEKRLKKLEGTRAEVLPCDADDFGSLMRRLAELAEENGMEIVSCAEEVDLRPFGILPGKCVDDRVIAEALGIEVPGTKDPTQRKACGCVISRDVGMYESCMFGCQYCYATKSFAQAKINFDSHDPKSPSLLGWYEMPG
jgi:hypothetical protein